MSSASVSGWAKCVKLTFHSIPGSVGGSDGDRKWCGKLAGTVGDVTDDFAFNSHLQRQLDEEIGVTELPLEETHTEAPSHSPHHFKS